MACNLNIILLYVATRNIAVKIITIFNKKNKRKTNYRHTCVYNYNYYIIIVRNKNAWAPYIGVWLYKNNFQLYLVYILQ